jgi:hypothetical protein
MTPQVRALLVVGVVGGVIYAVTSAIPLVGGCLGCLLLIGVGAGVPWQVKQGGHGAMETGTAALYGAGAAVVATLVSGLIAGLLILVGLRPGLEAVREEALKQFEEMPPEQAEAARAIVESGSFWVVLFGCGLVLYAILGAIGGAIGASVFGDDADPTVQGA